MHNITKSSEKHEAKPQEEITLYLAEWPLSKPQEISVDQGKKRDMLKVQFIGNTLENGMDGFPEIRNTISTGFTNLT